MITTVMPMSTDHARALAQAYELERLLKGLCDRPENGEGSPLWEAWGFMEDVVAHLEPLEADDLKGDDDPAHGLRLLVTDPREYTARRVRRTIRGLATKPWRRP